MNLRHRGEGEIFYTRKTLVLNNINIKVEKLQFQEILPSQFSKKIAMLFEHMTVP